MERLKEGVEGEWREGRKCLQTNSWILKTAHTHTEMLCCHKLANFKNLWPSVAEVNFEPNQTLTCQNMSETKSVRRRNLDIIRQHFGTLLGSLIYSVERFCQHLWAKFHQNCHVCQICHFCQIRQHFGTLLYRQINIFSLKILSTRQFQY